MIDSKNLGLRLHCCCLLNNELQWLNENQIFLLGLTNGSSPTIGYKSYHEVHWVGKLPQTQPHLIHAHKQNFVNIMN